MGSHSDIVVPLSVVAARTHHAFARMLLRGVPLLERVVARLVDQPLTLGERRDLIHNAGDRAGVMNVTEDALHPRDRRLQRGVRVQRSEEHTSELQSDVCSSDLCYSYFSFSSSYCYWVFNYVL